MTPNEDVVALPLSEMTGRCEALGRPERPVVIRTRGSSSGDVRGSSSSSSGCSRKAACTGAGARIMASDGELAPRREDKIALELSVHSRRSSSRRWNAPSDSGEQDAVAARERTFTASTWGAIFL